MDELAPGLTGEVEAVVTEADTADHWGSGLVPVFGTPALVGLMENAAVQALVDHLPPVQTARRAASPWGGELTSTIWPPHR